jgi:hypothetical protein
LTLCLATWFLAARLVKPSSLREQHRLLRPQSLRLLLLPRTRRLLSLLPAPPLLPPLLPPVPP